MKGECLLLSLAEIRDMRMRKPWIIEEVPVRTRRDEAPSPMSEARSETKEQAASA